MDLAIAATANVHRVPLLTAERVLTLYQDRYSGLGVRQFHRALRSEHGIRLSYNWLKQALKGAGLLSPSVSNLVGR